MEYFTYKVAKDVSINGSLERKIFTGKISSLSAEDAQEKLEKIGYEVIQVKKSFFNISCGYKLSQKEMINFFSSIAAIDRVGIDILYALEMIKNDVADNGNLKKVCEKIYFSVATGTPLSDACREASSSFTHDIIGLIKIAEQTGKFYKIFTEIIDYIKWNFDIKIRAKRAIRGPMFTFCFMIAIMITMSTVILPKIIDFISYFDTKIPIYTKALIAFSTFIKTKWFFILIFCLVIYICLKVLSLFNNEIGVKIDYLRLKIPLFGNLILKMDTSRFITFFSIMYKNNADVLEIMTSVSKIVTNRYFAKKILDIRDKISDGMTIFSSINQEQIFPTMFRKMMAICETTGEVEFILENVRYFYEAEVKEITDKFVGLIKPVTTIILGFMLAWMGLAMLTPIYSQIGSIGDMSAQNSNY